MTGTVYRDELRAVKEAAARYAEQADLLNVCVDAVRAVLENAAIRHAGDPAALDVIARVDSALPAVWETRRG